MQMDKEWNLSFKWIKIVLILDTNMDNEKNCYLLFTCLVSTKAIMIWWIEDANIHWQKKNTLVLTKKGLKNTSLQDTLKHLT